MGSIGAGSLTVSERIVDLVAEKEGVLPDQIPVLFDVVDSEALDQLVASMASKGEVTFQYNGFDVTIDSSEQVTVVDGDDL